MAQPLWWMEGTEVEAAYKKLLVTFNQFNFERLGFEPKAGEADEEKWFVNWLFQI